MNKYGLHWIEFDPYRNYYCCAIEDLSIVSLRLDPHPPRDSAFHEYIHTVSVRKSRKFLDSLIDLPFYSQDSDPDLSGLILSALIEVMDGANVS